MKKITIVLILFALVLTACSALGAKAKDENNADIEKITPSPGKASMELEADPVIVYQRSGGIAGVDEEWSIYATGKIVQKDGKEFSVDPVKVAVLLETVETAGLGEFKPASGIGGISNCKDCFTYTLTLFGDEKPLTISAQDGAKDVPEAFWTLINQIHELVTGAAIQ